jgi:hypothetical protein
MGSESNEYVSVLIVGMNRSIGGWNDILNVDGELNLA